tara:strand:+ start:18193 stop:18741 length:549 start_codon:yes stop_codon:yes gene_type:complete
MEIQTYAPRGNEVLVFSGDVEVSRQYHFTWYFGGKNIGLEGNFSAEAEVFMSGLARGDKALLVTPHEERPRIILEDVSYGIMAGREAGIGEVQRLIAMLQGNDVTHVYNAVMQGEVHNVLGPTYGMVTFAPEAPPEEVYEAGKIIPVRLDESNLESIARNEELQQEISDRMQSLRKQGVEFV